MASEKDRGMDRRTGWLTRVAYFAALPSIISVVWLKSGMRLPPNNPFGQLAFEIGLWTTSLLIYFGIMIAIVTAIIALITAFRKTQRIHDKFLLWAIAAFEGWTWLLVLDFFNKQ